MADCVRLDRDCADLCRLAAMFLARESELAGEVCRICAEACDDCGAECARHKMDHCQRCAEACGRCAEECRQVAAATA